MTHENDKTPSTVEELKQKVLNTKAIYNRLLDKYLSGRVIATVCDMARQDYLMACEDYVVAILELDKK